VEARLVCLHRHESVLEAGQTAAMEQVEQQLPAFTRASQNVVVVAALLDALPAPSTDGVGEMYQRPRNILGTTATQQLESTLQH
jgi:hypothetical protein